MTKVFKVTVHCLYDDLEKNLLGHRYVFSFSVKEFNHSTLKLRIDAGVGDYDEFVKDYIKRRKIKVLKGSNILMYFDDGLYYADDEKNVEYYNSFEMFRNIIFSYDTRVCRLEEMVSMYSKNDRNNKALVRNLLEKHRVIWLGDSSYIKDDVVGHLYMRYLGGIRGWESVHNEVNDDCTDMKLTDRIDNKLKLVVEDFNKTADSYNLMYTPDSEGWIDFKFVIK